MDLVDAGAREVDEAGAHSEEQPGRENSRAPQQPPRGIQHERQEPSRQRRWQAKRRFAGPEQPEADQIDVVEQRAVIVSGPVVVKIPPEQAQGQPAVHTLIVVERFLTQRREPQSQREDDDQRQSRDEPRIPMCGWGRCCLSNSLR